MATEGLHPIGEIVQNLIGAHNDGLRAGFEYAEQRFYPALRVLDDQYKKAQHDPSTKVPTALHMAIVNLLTLLKPQDATNADLPEARRERLSPITNPKEPWRDNPAVDLDLCGRTLKAGT